LVDKILKNDKKILLAKGNTTKALLNGGIRYVFVN